MALGGDDHACEPRRATSAAMQSGNAHDVDAEHLLCGPQHAHDHVGRPVAAVNGRCGRAAVQVRLLAEVRLLPNLADVECDVRVRRRWVFEDCFVAIMRLRLEDLRKRFMVRFEGEDALLDYGGVSRE